MRGYKNLDYYYYYYIIIIIIITISKYVAMQSSVSEGTIFSRHARQQKLKASVPKQYDDGRGHQHHH